MCLHGTHPRIVSVNGGWLNHLALYAAPDSLPISQALFQHSPVLGYIDIPLTAGQHQIPIIAKVAIPVDDILIGPFRRIGAHLFVRHAIEIGAQINRRLVGRLLVGFLLKVPSWLGHGRMEQSTERDGAFV